MAETTKAKWNEGTGVVANRKEWGYSSSRTANVETKVVEVIHVSRCEDGKDVYIRTLVDFSNTDESDILEVAAGSIIIAARPVEFRTRKSDVAIAEMEGATLAAEDYIKRERATTKDPVKTVTNGFDKMSKEQQAEMIKILEAKMKS